MVKFTGKIKGNKESDIRQNTINAVVDTSESNQSYWGQLANNIIPSAQQFVKDTITPFMQPIQTAKDIGALGNSIIALAIDGSDDPDSELAKAVGQYFADRYGGFDEIANTFKSDPIGMLADVSIVLTGGASLTARLPSTTVKAVSQAIGKAKYLDLSVVGVNGTKVAGKYVTKKIADLTNGNGLVSTVLGNTTGVGGVAVKTAYESGKAGGETNRIFLNAMRGGDDATNVVLDSQKELKKMKTKARDEYNTTKRNLGLQNQKLGNQDDVNKIINDLQRNFENDWTRNGASRLGDKGDKIYAKITKKLDEFRNNPAEHTLDGLDWLKQQVQAEYPSFENPKGQAVVSEFANGIKNIIVEADPKYAKLLDDFGTDMAVNKAIEKGLSMNQETGNVFRKLSSSIKDNVNTNFGDRLSKVNKLDDAGNSKILERISGMSLNSPTPRGLQSLIPSGVVGAGLATGTGAGLLNPVSLATMGAFSPRLVGEGANIAGRTAGGLTDMYNTYNRSIPSYTGNALTRGLLQYPSRVGDNLTEEEKEKIFTGGLINQ